MFRFLLRDEHMAGESDLSDQAVTHETVDWLFAWFRPDMCNCLLFLTSVRLIRRSESDERTGKLFKLCAVVATLSSWDQGAHDEFARRMPR
jgi:hypothetical protein